MGPNRKQPALTWHTAEQPVSFEGLTFRSGLFYTTESSPPWPSEPSAINTALKVAGMPENPDLDLGYYPNYEQLTNGQRRAYVNWLAAGRRDEDPSQRALGYVFLAFYGFERRLLVDGDLNPAIFAELMGMFHHYDGASRSRSLRSYFLQLLHFAGWKQGPQAYRALWPELLQLDGDRPNEEGMRLVLANLHGLGEPMDWTVAYRVALLDEDSRRSMVVSRTREKFWELFRQRFAENYPGGIALQALKHPVSVQYRPASQALIQMMYQSSSAAGAALEERISNVIGMRRQFKKLPEIWNSCVEALSGYSRAVASKKQGVSAGLATWNALPPELRQQESHPLADSLQEVLAGAPLEAGFPIVPVSAVASLMDIVQRDKLTGAQSAKIVETMANMGWFMAPPPQLTNVPFAWTQEVALYPRQPGEGHGAQIPGLIRLLYLTITLAAADGVIDDEEIEVFNRQIAPEIQSEQDWSHIRATEAVLRRDANAALRALPQIARHVGAKSRPSVFRMLAHTAAADGEICLNEMKMLRRIARAFELEEDALDVLLMDDEAFGEVTVAGRENVRKDEGERIPPRIVPEDQPATAKKGFQLDMDRIQALKQETHEIISMLSQVMDEEEEPSLISASEKLPEKNEAATPDVSTVWLAGLDRRYHAALLQLVRHDEVAPEDFDRLASTHHLMPDDLLDAVNAWSDETLGDFLLEREENIRIFHALLPPEAVSVKSLPLAHAA